MSDELKDIMKGYMECVAGGNKEILLLNKTKKLNYYMTGRISFVHSVDIFFEKPLKK